ncbi:MAG TPA: glycosyltransferase family 1 protein [Gaiellaceae bacterium]|nr:glycosyltransferase family 1 protein [Gaiellaceae bacterium]
MGLEAGLAPRPLRVGLNLVFLVEGSAGAGRYVTELLPSLLTVAPETRITAFVNREVPKSLFSAPWSGEVDWVRLPVTIRTPLHLAAQAGVLPLAALRKRLDVLHSPANGGPPVTPGTARVITLLDLIWLHQQEAWDSPRAVRTLALLSRISARTAHRVITISNSARDDLVAHFDVPPEKVDVAPLGVRVPERAEAVPDLRARLELGDDPLVLCVAQKRPYKNIGALIHAIADLADEPATLVLPGASTPYEAELRALAERLGVASRVRFLDWISEADLDGLYREATCFVLPSLIEGFGLPVLEAMARDLPVACSNRPSLPEVAGDAALQFDPEDQTAVSTALRRLLTDEALRSELVARGLERVRLFTWERTAEATLASYRRAVEARSR